MQAPTSKATGEARVTETREQAELGHAKMNESLIGTFTGTLQEQTVAVNSTGK